jgi:hypothetical protein
MRTRVTLLSCALVLGGCGPAAEVRVVTYQNGEKNVVDAQNAHPRSSVYVKDSSDGKTTTLELKQGGKIGRGLEAQDGSIVNMLGGTIVADFGARDRSVVRISGGSIGEDLEAKEEATLEVTGGEVGDDLEASDRAKVTLLGGKVVDGLEATGQAVITVSGSGFNLPLGDLEGSGGQLTGTLADGTRLDVRFERGPRAKITLVEAKAGS